MAPEAAPWVGPINGRQGMPLSRRAFGAHYDPASTQRRIGRSVYIFRRVPTGIDVWRLVITPEHAHCWTHEHAVRP